MQILEKARENARETQKEVISQGLGMVSSAFILVAALAWNDAIHELITQYFHSGSGITSRFIYALIVTVMAVIITVRLNKIVQRFKDPKPKQQ